MKIVLACSLLVFVLNIAACKKDNKIPLVKSEVEVNATVVLSTGETIIINASGDNAKMGCTLLGGGSYISATNAANASVYIGSVYSSGLSCVTSPGTYNFECQYRKNTADPNTPIWSNWANNVTNKGSITFTTFNDNIIEGNFHAIAKCFSPGCAFGVDSAIISGTFKKNF